MFALFMCNKFSYQACDQDNLKIQKSCYTPLLYLMFINIVALQPDSQTTVRSI